MDPNVDALLWNGRGRDGYGTERIYGVVPAIVVKIDDSKEKRHLMGSVQVRFPWLLDEGAVQDVLPWARCVTFASGQDGDGAECGWVSTPQVGDEVLVGFESGDIHRPYVLGQLSNPKGGDAPAEGGGGGAGGGSGGGAGGGDGAGPGGQQPGEPGSGGGDGGGADEQPAPGGGGGAAPGGQQPDEGGGQPAQDPAEGGGDAPTGQYPGQSPERGGEQPGEQPPEEPPAEEPLPEEDEQDDVPPDELPPSRWANDMPGPALGSPAYQQRLVEAANLLVTKTKDGKKWAMECCWDWAWAVYVYARLHPDIGGSVDENPGYYLEDAYGPVAKGTRNNTRHYLGDEDPSLPIQHAKGATRRTPLPDSRYGEIQPGDWLWIYNANDYDAHGEHSVVFLEWKDQGGKVARTCSQHVPGAGGVYDEYDFNQVPVTGIWRSG